MELNNTTKFLSVRKYTYSQNETRSIDLSLFCYDVACDMYHTCRHRVAAGVLSSMHQLLFSRSAVGSSLSIETITAIAVPLVRFLDQLARTGSVCGSRERSVTE